MFTTNKRSIQTPEFIMINNQQVKVDNDFKLLSIIIDNKLNFAKNTCKVRKSINIRLYAIQKLFQLPICVSKLNLYKHSSCLILIIAQLNVFIDIYLILFEVIKLLCLQLNE